MTLQQENLPRLLHSGLPLGGQHQRRSTWLTWNRGLGLAMFTGLAGLSGATSVIVLHRFNGLQAGLIETGAIAPQSLVPRTAALSLAHSVLARLDEANRSGNYEAFRSGAAPGFQTINSAADLAQIFGWLRKEGAMLSGPGLDDRALKIETIEPRGLLRLTGTVKGEGDGLHYDIILQQSAGDWRLFGIAVYKG